MFVILLSYDDGRTLWFFWLIGWQSRTSRFSRRHYFQQFFRWTSPYASGSSSPCKFQQILASIIRRSAWRFAAVVFLYGVKRLLHRHLVWSSQTWTYCLGFSLNLDPHFYRCSPAFCHSFHDVCKYRKTNAQYIYITRCHIFASVSSLFYFEFYTIF